MSRPQRPGPVEAGQDHFTRGITFTNACGDVQARRKCRQVDGDDMDPDTSTPRRRLAAAMVPRGQLPGQRLAAPTERSAHCCAQVHSLRCRHRDSRGDAGERRAHRHLGRELLSEPTAGCVFQPAFMLCKLCGLFESCINRDHSLNYIRAFIPCKYWDQVLYIQDDIRQLDIHKLLSRIQAENELWGSI